MASVYDFQYTKHYPPPSCFTKLSVLRLIVRLIFLMLSLSAVVYAGAENESFRTYGVSSNPSSFHVYLKDRQDYLARHTIDIKHGTQGFAKVVSSGVLATSWLCQESQIQPLIRDDWEAFLLHVFACEYSVLASIPEDQRSRSQKASLHNYSEIFATPDSYQQYRQECKKVSQSTLKGLQFRLDTIPIVQHDLESVYDDLLKSCVKVRIQIPHIAPEELRTKLLRKCTECTTAHEMLSRLSRHHDTEKSYLKQLLQEVVLLEQKYYRQLLQEVTTIKEKYPLASAPVLRSRLLREHNSHSPMHRILQSIEAHQMEHTLQRKLEAHKKECAEILLNPKSPRESFLTALYQEQDMVQKRYAHLAFDTLRNIPDFPEKLQTIFVKLPYHEGRWDLSSMEKLLLLQQGKVPISMNSFSSHTLQNKKFSQLYGGANTLTGIILQGHFACAVSTQKALLRILATSGQSLVHIAEQCIRSITSSPAHTRTTLIEYTFTLLTQSYLLPITEDHSRTDNPILAMSENVFLLDGAINLSIFRQLAQTHGGKRSGQMALQPFLREAQQLFLHHCQSTLNTLPFTDAKRANSDAYKCYDLCETKHTPTQLLKKIFQDFRQPKEYPSPLEGCSVYGFETIAELAQSLSVRATAKPQVNFRLWNTPFVLSTLHKGRLFVAIPDKTVGNIRETQTEFYAGIYQALLGINGVVPYPTPNTPELLLYLNGILSDLYIFNNSFSTHSVIEAIMRTATQMAHADYHEQRNRQLKDY